MSTHDAHLTRLILAALWFVTGVLSLGIYPQHESFNLLARVGVHGSSALVVLYFAAALDITLSVMTIYWHSRALWIFQAALILSYTLIISVWLPEFWLHPFGPILKNFPILMLLWLLYKNEGTQK